jgi:hypothetical protein
MGGVSCVAFWENCRRVLEIILGKAEGSISQLPRKWEDINLVSSCSGKSLVWGRL